METDELIHTAIPEIIVPDVVDHLRNPFSYHRILGEMEPHDVAEDVAPHNGGSPLKQSPSNAIAEHGKIAHVHHRLLDLPGLDLRPGRHHDHLLFDQRDRGRPDTLLLLTLHDEVKGMIPVRAIGLAGVTRETIGQDPGVFATQDLLPLLPGLLQAQFHVLASHQAVQGLATIAGLFVIP